MADAEDLVAAAEAAGNFFARLGDAALSVPDGVALLSWDEFVARVRTGGTEFLARRGIYRVDDEMKVNKV